MVPPRVLAAISSLTMLCVCVGPADAIQSRFALVNATDKEGGAVGALGVDDFIVEVDGHPSEVIGATRADYPIAIVLDTSSFARFGFQQLRDAAHRFVGALSGREIGLYSTASSPRVLELTRNLDQVEAAIARTFAAPDAMPRTRDAVVRAANDLRERRAAITRIIVLSGGGADSSGEPRRAVVDAVFASRSIVDVVDIRQSRAATPTAGHSSQTTQPSLARVDADAEFLQTLAGRTLGTYERILTPLSYELSLNKLRTLLDSEMVIEYVPAAQSANKLRIGVRLPGVIVRGVAIERPQP